MPTDPTLRDRLAEALRRRLSAVHRPGGMLEPEEVVDYIGLTEFDLADVAMVAARHLDERAMVAEARVRTVRDLAEAVLRSHDVAAHSLARDFLRLVDAPVMVEGRHV